jgi:hypothetical protein
MALLEMTKNKVISLAPVEGSDDILIRATGPGIPLPTGSV